MNFELSQRELKNEKSLFQMMWWLGHYFIWYLVIIDLEIKKLWIFRVREKADIKIGNNVWIWARVTVLKGVNIGDNVVIWAGSVVVKDIPSNCVAVWNPCKKIRELS
jgi:acetyltransferase-like isoleucine patch superfamily enzyme